MNTKKMNKGFTLIEVLISIVIIGIMSAVTILSYKGYVKMSNESATKQELAQIAQVFEVGALDNKFDSTKAAYTYDELKALYEDITGYTMPFSSDELSYASSKLTLSKRDVTAKYDFTTKNLTLQ